MSDVPARVEPPSLTTSLTTAVDAWLDDDPAFDAIATVEDVCTDAQAITVVESDEDYLAAVDRWDAVKQAQKTATQLFRRGEEARVCRLASRQLGQQWADQGPQGGRTPPGSAHPGVHAATGGRTPRRRTPDAAGSRSPRGRAAIGAIRHTVRTRIWRWRRPRTRRRPTSCASTARWPRPRPSRPPPPTSRSRWTRRPRPRRAPTLPRAAYVPATTKVGGSRDHWKAEITNLRIYIKGIADGKVPIGGALEITEVKGTNARALHREVSHWPRSRRRNPRWTILAVHTFNDPHHGRQSPQKLRHARAHRAGNHVRDPRRRGGAARPPYAHSSARSEEEEVCLVAPGRHHGARGSSRIADLPLYGSERLVVVKAGDLVVVTEGEKDADALLALDIPAVGTVTGSSGCPSDDVLEILAGFSVAVWPDLARDGRAHMQQVLDGLRRVKGDRRGLSIIDGAAVGITVKGGGAADWTTTGDPIDELWGSLVRLDAARGPLAADRTTRRPSTTWSRPGRRRMDCSRRSTTSGLCPAIMCGPRKPSSSPPTSTSPGGKTPTT